MDNGRTRFFDAWGWYSQWPPITEIINLQKMAFIGFPFTWLLNFKFVEHRKSIASLKIFIAPPGLLKEATVLSGWEPVRSVQTAVQYAKSCVPLRNKSRPPFDFPFLLKDVISPCVRCPRLFLLL